MFKIYKEHYSKITSTPCNQLKLCNCQIKAECPMDEKRQTMGTAFDCRVTAPEAQKKFPLGQQKKNGMKGIITIKSHSITNDTHMRRHFQVICLHLKETFNATPEPKWPVVRCNTPYSNISKRYLLCLYKKLVIIIYPIQHELLNNQSELFCKCLLKDFRVNGKG